MAPDPKSLSTFHQALADLQRWLADAQVQGVVVGGVAVALLGRPRMTRDLDLVIWARDEQLSDFVERGNRFGFAARISDLLAFAERSRILVMRHVPSQLPVDVSLGGVPFEEEMIRTAQTIAFDAFEVRVPRVEDLFVLKAIAGRDKDLADLEGLVSKNPDLDRTYVRRRAKEFAAMMDQPDLPELFERFLVKPKRR
jgi:predicted nucleotidyltransferase